MPSMTVRRPLARVLTNWRNLPSPLRVRITFSFNLRISEAEIIFAERPQVERWDWLEIDIGPSIAQLYTRFGGYVTVVSSELYPNAWTVLAKGPLIRAALTYGDGRDLAYGGAGRTDQQMVTELLQASGVQNLSIGGLGRTLGTVATDQFVWDTRQSALDFIEELDAISLGYRTFNTPYGATTRQLVSGIPPDAPVVTFTEGVDIERASAQVSWADTVNEWTVSGYDERTFTTTGIPDLLPPGVTAVPRGFSSSKIERSLATEAGSGISCEEVAKYLVTETNRVRRIVRFTTPRGDFLFPGIVVGVLVPTRLGVGRSSTAAELFWLQEVVTTLDESGQFAQELTCIGGYGPAQPDTSKFGPIADFRLILDQEKIVSGTTEMTLYLAVCTDTSTARIGSIGTRAWTTSGGTPASGSGSQFTAWFSSTSGTSVTLQVQDSGGRSAMRTRALSEVAAGDRMVRRLYAAASVNAEAFTGSSWNVDPPSAGSVTVCGAGPYWAAGSLLMRSTDDLATSATESQPFGSGGTITAIGCELDAYPDRVVLGASDGRIAVSEDSGATWTVRSGPAAEPVLRIFTSRFVAGELHVLTAGGYYVSPDDGASWRTIRLAVSGQTFRDLILSHTRNVIASAVTGSGAPLEITETGDPFSFPALTPAVTDVLAVAPHIQEDRFFCVDNQGRTFWTDPAGSLIMTQRAALPAGVTLQVRGLAADGLLPAVLYLAGGTGGLWKSVDGFATAAGYQQLRKPGVGTSAATADYRMVLPHGRAGPGPIPPTTVVSKPSANAGPNEVIKAKSLWTGSTNSAPPAGWQSLSFDDSAWGAAVLACHHVFDEGREPAGSTWIWDRYGCPIEAQGVQNLIRHRFRVPAGLISQARIQTNSDDNTLGIWINGVFVGNKLTGKQSGPITIEFSPDLIRPGEDNIIAVWATDIYSGYAWTAYRLELA